MSFRGASQFFFLEGNLVSLDTAAEQQRETNVVYNCLNSGESHAVTCSHHSRCFHHGVHACTGKQAGGTDLASVVPSERPQNVGVPGEFILGECRRHTAWIGQDNPESYRVTDCQLATDPIVLDEPNFVRADDHIHPERRWSKRL